jgi:hypothetical protein
MNRHYYAAQSLLYFVFPFYMFRALVTTEPFRIQSVCSLIASVLLSPVGIRHALHWPVTALEQTQSTRGYLVYTITDMVLGTFYYPHSMKKMEGYVHHLLSGAFALYCLSTDRCFLMSQCFIVEVPTILHTLSRLFPSVFQRPLVKKYLFPSFFLVCRLVIFPYQALQNDLTMGEGTFALAFLSMNARWFIQCVKKEWKFPAR